MSFFDFDLDGTKESLSYPVVPSPQVKPRLVGITPQPPPVFVFKLTSPRSNTEVPPSTPEVTHTSKLKSKQTEVTIPHRDYVSFLRLDTSGSGIPRTSVRVLWFRVCFYFESKRFPCGVVEDGT